MEIGLSTATFFGKVYTENSLELIKKMDIKTCEIFLTTYMEYEENFANLLVEKAKGLNVYSIHDLTSQFEPQLYNSAERTSNDAFKLFKKVLNTGEKLGAKVYTFHGLSSIKKQNLNDIKRIAEITEILAQTTKTKNITLAYENVFWSYFNNPEFFNEIKKYSDTVGACLDIKQAMRSNHNWEEYLKVMSNRLCNVHLCDYDNNGKLCVCGKGVFDFYTLFRKLIDMGYDGPCMAEYYSKDYENLDDVKRSCDFLRNTLEKAIKSEF